MSSSSPALSHQSAKRYRLIAFIRVDPEDPEPLTHEEALAEKDQQEMISPENMYRIEEIPHP